MILWSCWTGWVGRQHRQISGWPARRRRESGSRALGRQLLPFQVQDLDKIVREIFHGGRIRKSVTMAKATLNTGQTLYAVNDIFVGPRSHVSARYNIAIGKRTENQSSSGVIISTGVGSTGWLKSLLAGAAGITQNNGANNGHRTQQNLFSGYKAAAVAKPVNLAIKSEFPWDAEYLCYTVREPFQAKPRHQYCFWKGYRTRTFDHYFSNARTWGYFQRRSGTRFFRVPLRNASHYHHRREAWLFGGLTLATLDFHSPLTHFEFPDLTNNEH